MLAVELLGKRKRLGVNQGALARSLGLEEKVIQAIETGRIGVDTETFRLIDDRITEMAISHSKEEAIA